MLLKDGGSPLTLFMIAIALNMFYFVWMGQGRGGGRKAMFFCFEWFVFAHISNM